MKLLTVHVVLICCSTLLLHHNLVHAEKEGKKIIFDTSIGLQEDNFEYNDDYEEPVVGSDEYYDDYRWVSVTREGYETEGTLEEAKAILADFVNEENSLLDDDDEQESDPATIPHEEQESDPATIPHEEQGSDPATIPHEGDDPATLPHLEYDDETMNYEQDISDNINGEDEDDFNTENTITQNTAKEQFMKVTGQRVFGRDTRRRVTNLNRFPFRAMGYIKRGCTGTLIGRRVVLTAAHCFYTNGRWNHNINFQRKKNCDRNQGINMVWKRAVTYRAWTRRAKRKFDIGIIILYHSSPTWMSMSVVHWRHLWRSIINIAGYPGDKTSPRRCMWATHCRVIFTLRNLLTYRCDTYGGMSGSAIFHYYRRTRRSTIVGVHTFGSRWFNGGTRINRKHRRNIHKWIRKYSG